MSRAVDRLTKADTVALWHAVDALALQVKVMPQMQPLVDEKLIEQERQRLAAARRALRKVNAVRKAWLP
jgi:hypothetical protein